MSKNRVAMDGNTAAAYTAHKTNEVIAIYPITPSSVMGELSDAWSAKGDKNIWGTVPSVIEMQSEGGAAGAVHGSLTAGALTTTFTASQGLLLMIPNMYKIAGELTSTTFHVSAREVAAHALSIFGGHSDVMACRQTGWAMLSSANPQEVMDFALIAQAATLKTRVPFLHFFDGFRTSHELNMVEPLSTEVMRSMISEKLIAEHKARGLNPEHPVLRGTAQNPDVFFQGREASNKFYAAVPTMVKEAMGQFEKLTGRRYNLFDYVGAPDATRVIVVMASGADVVEDTVNYLVSKGEKVGVIKVRLYRPYSEADFIKALPKTVKSIAVLDRTKEAGALGEPLYQDVVTVCATAFKAGALKEFPAIVGGRYGLGSKEFTPAMAKAVYDNLSAPAPLNSFTVGIKDDVTNLSLKYDEAFITEPADTFRGLFFGLGSDGTIGANKNTIKIISEETGQFAQGYFVYDSKKAGSMTASHLRFGKSYIRAPYLVSKARFVACHQFSFLEKYEMLNRAEDGGIFLLNSPFPADRVWDKLPVEVQYDIVKKNLKMYVIDASRIANETGMGARINVIMQTAFFGISGVLPKDEAIAAIKTAIKKTYAAKGDEVVNKNYAAVDQTLAAIQEVKVGKADSKIKRTCEVTGFPKFVRETLCEMIAFRGDQLPVSAMPVDGTFPTATSQYEKRNIALESPVWEPHLCIQCGFCSLVCPHAAIRLKAYDGKGLEGAPKTFKSSDAKAPALKGLKLTVQAAVEDCTGCGACVYNCPAKEKKDGAETGRKAINMSDQFPLREPERENLKFFMALKDEGSSKVNRNTVHGSQLVRPLFEFSGACAGCGETPYVKLMTQLYGDHLTVANATGCSSIYGGNLPTTPYCVREDGRGPAWSNSLFEDNAEFGLGMRLAYDKMGGEARELLAAMKEGPLKTQAKLAEDILNANQEDWAGIEQQRARVADLKKALVSVGGEQAARMGTLADYLIKKSVWILGGDGWAYDIGYGGLDHVLASGRKVRMLVMDTEVYSNTGGQMSKATPLGAVAQFAAGGKPIPKKDLAMISMTYGSIYVAQVAMGADYNQTVKAFVEAEAYDGPSIIIAYSHCIAHGIDMRSGMNAQKKAVQSGRWPLFRYNPALRAQGRNPLTIDSKPPTISVADFMTSENRFRTLQKTNPEAAARLARLAEESYKWRLSVYQQIAAMSCDTGKKEEKVGAAA